MPFRLLIVILIISLSGGSAVALQPDEVLLVANGNAKESREWAEFYAKQRNVPAGNLVLLDVGGGEEIPRGGDRGYTEKIAKPVREWLTKNDPDRKIKCLLTFYGVPIRVANRSITPDEQKELKHIRDELAVVSARIGPLVRDIELLTKEFDPTFKPPTTQNVLSAQALRTDKAVERLVAKLNAEPNPEVRRRALLRLFASLDELTGPSGMLQRAMFKDLPAITPTTLPTTTPATQPEGGPAPIQIPATPPATAPVAVEDVTPAERREIVAAAQERTRHAAIKLNEFSKHVEKPEARQQMREFAKAEMGLVTYARVLDAHGTRLEPGETNAAVDNELALVLSGDEYPLYRWIDNPLYFRNQRRAALQPPVLMVMRLDGSGAETVRDIIKTSLAAEEQGLGGKFVIDARGLDAKKPDGTPDAYGDYDQALRDLATLVRDKTQMQLVLDDQQAVLAPHSVKDVGLYVGWYALRNYMGSCDLRNGAVGYHVASLEMVSLKQDGERGWVRGLLDDGIAATCGAVAEPYLHSFPRPDEFFPLLMTGELTLAEVYWRTAPLVSWQVAMIGDPLYRPFKRSPALKVEDLPGELRAALRTPERLRR